MDDDLSQDETLLLRNWNLQSVFTLIYVDFRIFLQSSLGFSRRFTSLTLGYTHKSLVIFSVTKSLRQKSTALTHFLTDNPSILLMGASEQSIRFMNCTSTHVSVLISTRTKKMNVDKNVLTTK